MAIIIRSLEEALANLQLQVRPEDAGLKISGDLRTLEIEIEGELFHGGITGELARGLSEFQDELYRAARFSITGKEGRDSRLTKEQKELLELEIEVKEGCTLITFNLDKFSDGLIKILGDQVTNMTAGEVQFVVLAAIFLIASAWLGKTALTEHFKKKTALEENQEETARLKTVLDAQIKVVEALTTDKRLEKFAEATATGLTQVAVRATDAKSVRIGPIELDEDELAAMRKRAPRSASDTINETADFRIMQVDGTVNPFRLLLSSGAFPTDFSVEYDSTEFTKAEDDLIWSAFRERKTVRLQVKAEQLRGKTKGAVILRILTEP